MTAPDSTAEGAEADARAWLLTARRLHRRKRLAGYLGCTLGASLMLWGRFSPNEAPSFAIAGGLSMIIASWLVFVWVIVARYRWLRNNPFRIASR